MGRDLRFVPEGSLVEVTTRTLQGRFLLRPSPKLRDLVHGILARAARRYDVKVCAFIYLSNHCHLLLLPKNALHLARFMNYVNANVAKEAGRLHGWREKFWSRRYRAIVVSDEELAQVGRLRYLLAQGCKEGLIASPRHWPGASSVKAQMAGDAIRGIWIDRTSQWAARQRGESTAERHFTEHEDLPLAALPCWKDLSPYQVQSRVRRIVREIERETEDDHRQHGTEPMGAKAVLEESPLGRPLRVHRSPAPRFHAATKKARRELHNAYSWFLTAYRLAAEDLESGLRKAVFPAGCFPPPRAFVHG